MIKFHTVEDYANLKGVNAKEPYEWVKQGKLSEVVIGSKLPKLVYEKTEEKEAEVIAFMNLKGGAGKTTVSVNIGVLLSKLGLKVLIIDTDHQNHVRLFFQEQKYENSIVDALEDPSMTKDCIYQGQSGTAIVDILFSSYNLSLMSADIKDEHLLTKVIEEVKGNYDVIIIDTSPAFDIISINAAKAASSIIIPLKPEPMHYEGMSHYLGALMMKTNIPKENLRGMLFNLVNEKAAQHKGYISILRDEYKGFCLENFVPLDVHVPKTVDTLMGTRTNIFDYKERSKASQALKRITWEILRRLS